MNTIIATKGNIVRCTYSDWSEIEVGRLYEVLDEDKLSDGTKGAKFKDNNGDFRVFWVPSHYEIVGKVVEEPTLTDIHGQTVKVGDYVAYAFAGGRYASQSVFEVVRISTTGKFAVCRSVTDSTAIELGVFDQRALKLKDYAA